MKMFHQKAQEMLSHDIHNNTPVILKTHFFHSYNNLAEELYVLNFESPVSLTLPDGTFPMPQTTI